MRAVPVIAVLVMIAAPAVAQGTDVEREACTEDAVKLCSDTIPDIPKTTACMKAHADELTPRCRAIVASKPDRPERAQRVERETPLYRPRRVEREAPLPDDGDVSGARRYLYLTPDGEPAEAAAPSDRARARARIGRLCDDDQIDPETCELTERALR